MSACRRHSSGFPGIYVTSSLPAAEARIDFKLRQESQGEDAHLPHKEEAPVGEARTSFVKSNGASRACGGCGVSERATNKPRVFGKVPKARKIQSQSCVEFSRQLAAISVMAGSFVVILVVTKASLGSPIPVGRVWGFHCSKPLELP